MLGTSSITANAKQQASLSENGRNNIIICDEASLQQFLMQNQFSEEIIQSEFVPGGQGLISESKIPFPHDMPSYNPDAVVEERLRQTIHESIRREDKPQNLDSIRMLKHQSFYHLQAWLNQIGEDLSAHKQIVKEVYRVLDTRVQVSDRSIQNLIDFLKRFLAHEKANADYLRNKNVELVKLFRNGKATLYPQLQFVIKEIEKYDQGNAEKIFKLLDGIEKFIQDKIEKNMADFNSAYKQVKDKYFKCFSAYAQKFSQLNKYRKKYHSLYNLMMVQDVKRKDLYYVEKKLINSFIDAGKFQQQLGIYAHKLWEELQKQELMRYETVVQSLRMYLDKHVLLTQSKQQKLSSQEELIYTCLNQIVPEDEIQESMNLIRFLDAGTVKQLQRMLNTNEINKEKLIYFLTKYPEVYLKLAEQQEHKLVKYQVKNAQVDSGALLTTWNECTLLVTVDRNLIIYLKGSQSFYKKFHLPESSLTQKARSPLIAELKERRPGFIFDSTTQVLLQLESPSDFDQIHGFIYNQALS